MRVSVRELKNNLAKYLQIAASGETVIVTSYKKPVAEIKPTKQNLEPSLANLLSMEGVTWSGQKPKGGTIRPVIKGKSVAETIIENRR